MKKTIINFAVILMLAFTVQNASAQFVTKGITLVDAGIQPGDFFTTLSVNSRFGIADNIAIGPQLDYSSYTRGSSTALFARGEYYFGQALNLPENVGAYSGISIGKYFETGAEIFSTLQLGASYLFTEKVGAHIETRFGLFNATGYNSSSGTFSLGVSFKL